MILTSFANCLGSPQWKQWILSFYFSSSKWLRKRWMLLYIPPCICVISLGKKSVDMNWKPIRFYFKVNFILLFKICLWTVILAVTLFDAKKSKKIYCEKLPKKMCLILKWLFALSYFVLLIIVKWEIVPSSFNSEKNSNNSEKWQIKWIYAVRNSYESYE